MVETIRSGGTNPSARLYTADGDVNDRASNSVRSSDDRVKAELVECVQGDAVDDASLAFSVRQRHWLR